MSHAITPLPASAEAFLVGGAVALLARSPTLPAPCRALLAGLVVAEMAVAHWAAHAARRDLAAAQANRDRQLDLAMLAGEYKARAEGCSSCSGARINSPRSAGCGRN